MFASTFSVLALVAISLVVPTPVEASSSNFTLRTTYPTVSATCTNVAGTAYGSKFNFGCLCLDDLDDFCGNNGINSYFKNIIYKHISTYGSTRNYPRNAQPTCDGNGGYHCGSLNKLSNGQCSTSNPCRDDQCFSNGGCCPRGQTYSNGKCCASTGCSRSGQVCTPVLTCAGYMSNNICCPTGTSGWVGQTQRCCPPGQIESADKSDCICPAGKKEDPKDANKCVDACATNCKWGATQCCPNDATEKNGVCVCPTGKRLSDDKLSCVNQCDTNNGWKWCNKRCCPKGSEEDSKGNCVCTDPQTILNSAGTACVDRCPNGNWGGSMCCNGASAECSGECICTSTSQKYSGSGDSGKCVDQCTGGTVWAPKQRICCPAGSLENSMGVCMCTDNSKKIVNNVCTDKCPNGVFNPTTQTCCPSGSTASGNTCSCPSTSQKYENGQCVNRCPNNWVFGANVPGQCCPPGSKPNAAGTACACNDPSLIITGSGTSQTCSNKCPQYWSYAPKQNDCCPPNSQEVGSACACTNNAQSITGSGTSRKCEDRCKSGWTWGGMKKQCCPPGSEEDCDGVCTCKTTSQVITGSGDSRTCTDRCAGKPSGWKWQTSICCPPGSTQKGDKCDCDDDNKQLSSDGQTCVDLCPTGQIWGGSRCCPSGSSQWYGTCLCDKWYLGYRPSADGTRCVPSCLSGYTFQDTKCCKDYLDEKNGQCVCPKSGDTDNGNSCGPSCPTGTTLNPTTKNCDPICADGFTYKKGWKNEGFCCRDSETACNTRCCPAPYVEIGDSGVCCTAGSQVVNHQCVGPTGGNTHPKRREVGQKVQLSGKAPSYFGIEANRGGKLCPLGLAACAIEGRGESEWECLDPQTDLQSCGGCASMGTGEDCTAIPGARWMGCKMGKCEVYSCKAGYKMHQGRCEKK